MAQHGCRVESCNFMSKKDNEPAVLVAGVPSGEAANTAIEYKNALLIYFSTNFHIQQIRISEYEFISYVIHLP